MRVALLVRLVVACAFGVSAYVHLDLARGPWLAGGEVTLAGLFVADAVTAVAAAVWVVVRPTRAAWGGALLVAVASLLALLASTYTRLPAPGPLPVLYDPVWYGEKAVAAVAAGVAALGSAVGLVVGLTAPGRAVR
jgi:hypothetical protein